MTKSGTAVGRERYVVASPLPLMRPPASVQIRQSGPAGLPDVQEAVPHPARAANTYLLEQLLLRKPSSDDSTEHSAIALIPHELDHELVGRWAPVEQLLPSS